MHSTRTTSDSSNNTNEHPTRNETIRMTPRQVSEAFDIDTETLAKWARHGKIQFTQTAGGHRRYRHQDVQKMLTSIASEKFSDQTLQQ
ncbi:MAG: MerR family regulatory protein [Rhodococcus erythropolis]|nr:MerR family regulatory protein [Rhodococcus erythropolis]